MSQIETPVFSLDDQRKDAARLCERLVEAAKRAGADAADATCGMGSSLSAKARDGAVEDITRSSSRAAGLRVIKDGRLGFVTSASAPASDDDIDEMARSAVDLAAIADQSPHNVIPDATAPSGDDLEAAIERLALWDGDTAGLSAAWAAERAVEMEKIVSASDGISTVRDCGASSRRTVFALATSAGFSGSYGGTMCQLWASAVADDKDGKKQVDGWYGASRRVATLDDPTAVAEEAARRARSRVGARKVESCRAPVIYDPSMSRTFFAAVLGAMNGDAVAREASFLAGKKGDAVFTPGYALTDDPFMPHGFGSRPFDGEGLAVAEHTLIDNDGRLQMWLLDARSAHRLGERPNGHAGRGSTSLPGPTTSNVRISGGKGDLASIIKETKRGLLVTSLLGHSPDMVTGEYSRGASGFWVEDGAIAFPVEEVTVAGDMLEMMKGLDRVGDDPEERSSLYAPSIRFAELQISGA